MGSAKEGREGAQSFFLAHTAGYGAKLGRVWGRGYIRSAQNQNPAAVRSYYLAVFGTRAWRLHAGGALLQRFLSPSAASVIGAAILILLGLWSLYQQVWGTRDRKVRAHGIDQGIAHYGTDGPRADEQSGVNREEHAGGGEALQKAVFSFEIRKLGLVIQILRSPVQADMDNSGSISSWEAMWLGIALSLDAFGAGLGAAMLGFSPLGTASVVALFSGIFLMLGMRVGLRFASKNGMRLISYLPALLLIIMGIMKLL